jgi:hypothetical protein
MRPSTTASVSAPTFHGIVTVQHVEEGNGYALAVFDPRSGKPTGGAEVAFRVPRTPVFSPDWTMLAVADLLTDGGDGAVTLGRFNNGVYQQIGHWVPTPSLEGGRRSFFAPAFNPADGRLWFTYEDPSASGVWFSVDPLNPHAAPRREAHALSTTDSHGNVAHEVKVPIKGAEAKYRATITRSSSELVSATAHGILAAAPGDPNSVFGYKCNQQIAPEKLLCLNDGGQAPLGSVVALTVPGETGQAVLTKIFPKQGGSVRIAGVLLSPDHRTVLLATSVGWFSGPVDGSQQPVLAFQDLDAPTDDIVTWR